MSALKTDCQPGVEFSRVIDISRLQPGQHYDLRLTAEKNECAALALRLHIPAVVSLKADIDILSLLESKVTVKGRIYARLTQQDSVSLEEFNQALQTDFEVQCIVNAGQAEEDDDEIEYMQDERLDLGELVTQYLSLEIDPYPRQQALAENEKGEKMLYFEEEAPEKTQRPFEKLSRLLKKDPE